MYIDHARSRPDQLSLVVSPDGGPRRPRFRVEAATHAWRNHALRVTVGGKPILWAYRDEPWDTHAEFLRGSLAEEARIVPSITQADAEACVAQKYTPAWWKHWLGYFARALGESREGVLQPGRYALSVSKGLEVIPLEELTRPARPDALTTFEPIRPFSAPDARRVELLDPVEWGRVEAGTVDLLVSHEVLFLLPDLDELARQVNRVLSPIGRFYLVAGCHTENPVWVSWRPRLEEMGHKTYSHEPLALMASMAKQGLLPSVRPLRESGWATFDPTEDGLGFSSVTALLDHQFRHKLLFRFTRK